jgi:hypothetical protein
MNTTSKEELLAALLKLDKGVQLFNDINLYMLLAEYGAGYLYDNKTKMLRFHSREFTVEFVSDYSTENIRSQVNHFLAPLLISKIFGPVYDQIWEKGNENLLWDGQQFLVQFCFNKFHPRKPLFLGHGEWFPAKLVYTFINLEHEQTVADLFKLT